jgi:hypothetical protein
MKNLKGTISAAFKQTRSHCSHGPVGRLSTSESDRPQAGGYNCDEMDLIPGSAKDASVDR